MNGQAVRRRLDGRVDTRKFAMTGAMTLIAGVMLWQAGDFPGRVALFPRVITAIIVVLGIIDLARIMKPAVSEVETAHDALGGVAAGPADGDRAASTTVAVAWFMALIIAVLLVGFLIAVPLYMVAFMRLHGRHSWRVILLWVASLWALLYFAFVRLLNLPLYDGLLL